MDPAAVSPTTIALGGETIPVRYKTGETGDVKVLLLDIDQYPTFFAMLNSELKLAEFVTEKPSGWAKTLMPDSLMDVVEKGTDLNFTSARRWAERRAKIEEASMPLAESMAAVQAKASANSVLTAALRSAGAPPPK